MARSRWLVSLQLALSVLLLVGAGLLARTLYNLQNPDLVYPTGHLLLVGIDLHDETLYDEVRRGRLLNDLVEELRRIPGVKAASFSELGLFSGDESTSRVEVAGYVPKRDSDRESAIERVGPGYFATLGVPITLGRDILESDRDGTSRICVINQAFAARFFAGRNPIGIHITPVDEAAARTVYQIVAWQETRTQSLRGEVVGAGLAYGASRLIQSRLYG